MVLKKQVNRYLTEQRTAVIEDTLQLISVTITKSSSDFSEVH